MKVARRRPRLEPFVLAILLVILASALVSCGSQAPNPIHQAQQLYQEAEDLELAGRHGEAIAKYQEIIAARLQYNLYEPQAPGHAIARIYHKWAGELEGQGEHDQAIAKYRELLAWNSDLGRTTIGGQDAEGGIFGTYVNWALELEARGEFCQAAEKYRAAHDCVTAPFDWQNTTYYSTDALQVGGDCLFHCAGELQAEGRYEAAIAEFSGVPASSDNYQAAQEAIPECYYSWAMELKSQNRNGEAIDRYVKILETHPKWPSKEKSDALLRSLTSPALLASFQQMLGAARWEGTVWLYRALLASYPTSPEAAQARQSLEPAVQALLADASGAGYASLPGFSAVTNVSTDLAEVEIRNACPNILTLLILGPQLEVVSIMPDSRARSYSSSETTRRNWTPSAWEPATVKLQPGEYQILAMVSGSSTLRLYGTRSFESKLSYTTYYYIATTYSFN